MEREAGEEAAAALEAHGDGVAGVEPAGSGVQWSSGRCGRAGSGVEMEQRERRAAQRWKTNLTSGAHLQREELRDPADEEGEERSR